MTTQKEKGVQWRHTSVLIRADIFARANEEGLNFSNECNRALADRLDIDYDQQQLPEETPVPPVIIASDKKIHPPSPSESGVKSLVRPVMNADDPMTPVQVLEAKKEHLKRLPKKEPEKIHDVPDTSRERKLPPPSKEKGVIRSQKENAKKAGAKKTKDRAIKRFIDDKLLRTDSGEGGTDIMGKDEMYQLFVRWCRLHSILPIPDRRTFGVALKNRFVIRDAMVDGIPYWVNVKLR